MGNQAIQVQGLQKSYKKIQVLKGVDFEVQKGAVFALLGSNGAGAFSYPLILLPFISSAFVPTKSMPPVIHAFAENQPVTSIVDAIRSLLAGQPAGNDIWVALAWCAGIMLVAYFFAMRVYKKRV